MSPFHDLLCPMASIHSGDDRAGTDERYHLMILFLMILFRETVHHVGVDETRTSQHRHAHHIILHLCRIVIPDLIVTQKLTLAFRPDQLDRNLSR